MTFKLNHRKEVDIEPGARFVLHEGDTLKNDKIDFEADRDGFYEFTGAWFFFLFPV